MRIDVITIFPEWFAGPFSTSLLAKASAGDLLDLHVHDLRRWTDDRHRTVDDLPYGGGAGMVMRADVWIRAAESVWNDVDDVGRVGAEDTPADGLTYTAGGTRPRTIVLTPRGRPFDQQLAQELANEPRLVLACGRYEGIDERVHELVATDEVSIGDYVLLGGEVAAATVVETSVERKSSSPMVATCACESDDHDAIRWGNLRAYCLTAAGARRSELPSRSTGLTAEPFTEA